MEVWEGEFEAMWEYGGLWVTVWHTFNSGRLARWHRVAKLIEQRSQKGFWPGLTERPLLGPAPVLLLPPSGRGWELTRSLEDILRELAAQPAA